MEDSGSLERLIVDPPEETGKLDWMELIMGPATVNADNGEALTETNPPPAPEEGDNQAQVSAADPSNGGPEEGTLDHLLGFLTEILLVGLLAENQRKSDRMILDLVDLNRNMLPRQDTMIMVPNPRAPILVDNNNKHLGVANNNAGNSFGGSREQGNSETIQNNQGDKGKGIAISDTSSRVDYDIIVPNSPDEDQELQTFQRPPKEPTQDNQHPIHNNGNNMWPSGIAKPSGKGSSRKRTADCEASEDKGLPQRRRLDGPSQAVTQAGANRGGGVHDPNARGILTLQGADIATMPINPPPPPKTCLGSTKTGKTTRPGGGT
ncbi:hypothetical protein PIB30_020421 [Stylosanthes scabra]|uniref:Uncharacterized protein n=1 Tax=Stylosanthes scabra TaxID=79078 RepID=A0ABU6S8K4_9FABA|nr:hypothetical protein [Stylosanthes scabra]